MEITDIIKDSFNYPFSDKKQFGMIFLVFLLLAIIIAGGVMSASYLAEIKFNDYVIGALLIICLIVSIISLILLCGYQLDLISVACEREDVMPMFNPIKNIKNAFKIILLYLVFYVIMSIISAIALISVFGFSFSGEIWGFAIAMIIYLLLLIVNVLISWMFSIALCRLAYYESLNEALKLKEVWDDLRTVGLANMLVYIIAMSLIFGVIAIIAGLIIVSLISVLNSIAIIIAALILFSVGSYIFIVQSRALGLLYSNVIYDY